MTTITVACKERKAAEAWRKRFTTQNACKLMVTLKISQHLLQTPKLKSLAIFFLIAEDGQHDKNI